MEKLKDLLSQVSLQQNHSDTWKWSLNPKGEFSVKAISKWVEERLSGVGLGLIRTTWNNLVPKNVNVFLWRTMIARLPVRMELDKKGIDLDSILCPCCENYIETVEHCIVSCEDAMSVWEMIFA